MRFLEAPQRVLPGERVATIGSCFAQHLSRHIARSGLDYFVAETAPEGMGAEEAKARNYGVFSARYGNVYTVRQALQLMHRAYGRFEPSDDVWASGDGWVDALRPTIEPKPLESIEAVRASRAEHLRCVRRVFEDSDWLVFTLGLTEAWVSRADGTVFPVAPGVSGGFWDPSRYRFVNFGIDAVRADLKAFITGLREVNPRCRVLLTVSPVPLIATAERRHVLVSTTYSKSVLRVACDEAERTFRDVIYFPSYEIITSPAAGGRYYDDDLRQVRQLGVGHVMRMFSRHFIEQAAAPAPVSTVAGLAPAVPALAAVSDVVCDEEVIEQSLAAVGLRAEARR